MKFKEKVISYVALTAVLGIGLDRCLDVTQVLRQRSAGHHDQRNQHAAGKKMSHKSLLGVGMRKVFKPNCQNFSLGTTKQTTFFSNRD